MTNSRQNEAVSQIISEIFLLAIAVTSISVLSIQIFSIPGPQDVANVTIVGKLENEHPVFELQRGESLEPDTKIYITIAGRYNRTTYTLAQLFMQNYIDNHLWNIGERVVLPIENVTGYKGPQIEGTIVDTKTNAIVFWGILQPGIITQHKGGIWHFDETHWTIDQTDEVKDNSGNTNHGIAKNNALIINGVTQPQNAVHNNSGYFDVMKDAYVRVPSSWSLNITKEITLEAWMKPQPFPSTLDIVDLEEKFGYTPYVVRAADDCYALVSEDQSKRGTLQTVRIDSLGNISYLNLTTFGDAKTSIALRPIISQMTETMYLIAYNSRIDNSNDLYMTLRTYNISMKGSIEYTGNELAFQDYVTGTPNRPSLQKMTDRLYAMAYWVPGYGGMLKSVRISSDGAFNASDVKSIRYDMTSGYDPCLAQVSEGVLAVAYRGASNHGMIKTFNISADGELSYTGKTIEFDSGNGFEPSLIRVSGTVFAVAYRNSAGHGCIKTFNITSNGAIVWTGNGMVFEDTVPCFDPCIVLADKDVYVVAYSTGNIGTTTGYIRTLKLEKNGVILGQYDSRREFKIAGRDRCYNPIILHLEEQLFGIGFTGPTDHPGELITINIELDTYPPHRGISKPDSFGIYANTSTVVGSINNVMVSLPIPTGWHHFAVTYDGKNISLYVHDASGTLLAFASRPYPNHQINMTSADLTFGRNYYGFMDEIAVYDKALTEPQVKAHVVHPGLFTWYTFR